MSRQLENEYLTCCTKYLVWNHLHISQECIYLVKMYPEDFKMNLLVLSICGNSEEQIDVD